ncbi:MAG: hypothetical protein ACK553_03010 [Planctomycetota bacterium]|jgi:hypothetical protein
MAIDYNLSELEWSRDCEEQFTDALEAGAPQTGKSTARSRLWRDPPSHRAVLALTDALLNHAFDMDLLQEDHRTRGILEHALQSLAAWMIQGIREVDTELGADEATLFRAMAAHRGAMLYRRFHALRLRHCEGRLLQLLLVNPVRSAVALGIDLLVDSPPHSWQDASLAIGALVQSNRWQIADVYPRLLDSTDPAVLSPALDLANLLFSERGVQPHPARERFDALLGLLGSVVARLATMEEDPTRFSQSVPEIQRILFDSVSLTVSLCHTMALLEDVRAVGKLNQAMELGHRRIRAEAAYALVRLGEQSAVDRLLELAGDDALRPRILAYAKQLGLSDRIEPEWESEESRARSMLALHLSQPEHFSMAPHHIEQIDQRELVLPDRSEPQTCFLFRYTYFLGDRETSNFALAGPFVHLLPPHISDWEPDAIYEVILQSLEE